MSDEKFKLVIQQRFVKNNNVCCPLVQYRFINTGKYNADILGRKIVNLVISNINQPFLRCHKIFNKRVKDVPKGGLCREQQG